MTQYVACKFHTRDTRTYTYSWDGESLAEGDQVRVTDARNGGEKRVYVVSITDVKPPFDCEPILGRYVAEPVPDLI